MISLQNFAQGLNTLERSLLEDFLRGEELCTQSKAVITVSLPLPPGLEF